MNQPQREPDVAMPDSSDTFILFKDDDGESFTLPPLIAPHYSPEPLKGQTVDSYAIDREKLAKVKQAAIHLGRSKAELIREGLDLVLAKYHDKLGDLDNSEPLGDAAKPEDGASPA